MLDPDVSEWSCRFKTHMFIRRSIFLRSYWVKNAKFLLLADFLNVLESYQILFWAHIFFKVSWLKAIRASSGNKNRSAEVFSLHQQIPRIHEEETSFWIWPFCEIKFCHFASNPTAVFVTRADDDEANVEQLNTDTQRSRSLWLHHRATAGTTTHPKKQDTTNTTDRKQKVVI